MADTPEGTGDLSVNDAVASLLTGPADTQESEAQSSAPADDTPAPTEDPAADAPEETASEQPTDEETTSEATEQEPEAPAKVKLPDGTEATLDDLIKGHLRQSDYTRKTQELANHRKAMEQEIAALRQERAQELQILNAAQQMLAQQLPPEPDLSLAHTDPVTFVQQKAAYDAALQRYQQLSAHQQRVAQQAQAEQQQAVQQHLAREAEALVERIPEWKNPEVAKTEKAALIELGKSYGYTDQELAQVYDSRAVAIMRDAMKYREMLAKKPQIEAKKVQPTQKVLKPGTAQPGASKSTEYARAHARLAQTGSVDDAVFALLKG